MNAEPIDVLVVGAGPTGLALAAHLVANGVRPRLVDGATDRVHESRALAIQPRTLEVLAPLGVSDRLVEIGNRAVHMRVHAGDRELAVPLFDLGLADTAYPFLLFLSQAETERILAEHLGDRGIHIERGVELIRLNQSRAFASALLRGSDGAEELVVARYVVGCDGAHSMVRTAAGIDFVGASYPQDFVLVDAEADGIDPGAAHVFLGDRGMLFFFPLGQPASWRLLAMRPTNENGDRSPDDVTLDEVQELANRYTDGKVRLHDPAWMTNFRLHHRAATRYRSGRVFLAGDAAHIHSPAGAQGMNTGIQDAVNLAWKLAQAIRRNANPVLLDTYDQERAPVGRNVLRFTDRAFTVATTENSAVRFARRNVAPVAMRLLTKSKTGRRYAFRTIAQLAIRYRRSPLSVNGAGTARRGPKAGDRLPDGPIRHDGRDSTLHGLIAQPGWHLLDIGATSQTLPTVVPRDVTTHRLGTENDRDVDAIIDATTAHRLGLTPAKNAIILVRPDGHIGYRSDDGDPDRLVSYLDDWLGGTAGAAPDRQ